MGLRIATPNESIGRNYLESVLTATFKKMRERWAERPRRAGQDPTAEVSTREPSPKHCANPWQKLRVEVGQNWHHQRSGPSGCGGSGELFFQPAAGALNYPYAPKARRPY